MSKVRISATVILIVGIIIGFFVYDTEINEDSNFGFKYGLDLAGGTQLIYRADTEKLDESEIGDSMSSLRDVIERRVNTFGVSEPVVQIESGVIGNSSEQRLIVELPGITDINQATELIGKTPLLEFKLLDKTKEFNNQESSGLVPQEYFLDTGLTGRLLSKAQLQFGGGHSGGLTNEPIVLLEFNNEGSELFAKITRENVGESLAIFLDNIPISIPVISEEISNGSAQISGSFNPEEARQLVRDLNLGALPVPIELISTQSIGASLGDDVKSGGIFAGIIGIIFVAIFLLIFYRFKGLVSVVSLGIYIALMLALFKLIPVVLTAAGIAGFILSIGMAVDANVLIFERIKEEFKNGVGRREAIQKGFSRAWLSIRDGNISSIITAIILFWFGTSLIKGFALTFGLGVIFSMLSAILISRTFLLSFVKNQKENV